MGLIEKESILARGGFYIIIAVVCGTLLAFFNPFTEDILVEYGFSSIGFISVILLFWVACAIATILVKPSKRKAKRGILR
jgi:hypothetical protein